MKYLVKMTPEAESDLRGIALYIRCELENPAAASDFLSAAEDAIYSLDNMPNRFPVCRRNPWNSQGVRITGVKNYSILYHVNEQLRRVTILRVFHSRMNF